MPFFSRKILFTYLGSIAFFFSVIRYWGYFEDAGRYLLQVVNYMHPERFVNDVPFMYGNQDSFTIYSPVMAGFYQLFGVNYGGMIATFLIQLVWCIACISLIILWTRKSDCENRAFGVFAICIMSLVNRLYGSGAYFPIIDHILVARFFAFAISLFALAFFFNKNKYVSLILFALASLMHPLIGGWGLPLWLFYHFPKTRFPVLVLSLFFPLSGFLHISKFDFYTRDWLSPPLCFTPNVSDTIIFVAVLIFWLSMWRLVRNVQMARFCLCMAFVQLIGVYFNYVGAFTGHILLFQAQPYRALLFSFVPMFPVAACFVHESMNRESLFERLRFFALKSNHAGILFVSGFVLFLVNALAQNFVQMSLEQNVGNVGFALLLMNLSNKMPVVIKLMLIVLTFVSFSQKRFWIALAFVVSIFNGYLSVLPLMTIVLYLTNLKGLLNKVVVALAFVASFAELLMFIQNSPLQNSTVGPVFLLFLFVLTLWILIVGNGINKKKTAIPVVLSIFLLFIWDFAKWDARESTQKNAEVQMDSFWDEPIFPQVHDRGKMLFVVDREMPLQSRFVFLTGTYGDETINIGEIFFKGQRIESSRRKNALLMGSNEWNDNSDYGVKILKVYSNPDTLLQRVNFLCSMGDITHLVTDYRNLPLNKVDSTYLNAKQMDVYLYECKRFQ